MRNVTHGTASRQGPAGPWCSRRFRAPHRLVTCLCISSDCRAGRRNRLEWGICALVECGSATATLQKCSRRSPALRCGDEEHVAVRRALRGFCQTRRQRHRTESRLKKGRARRASLVPNDQGVATRPWRRRQAVDESKAEALIDLLATSCGQVGKARPGPTPPSDGSRRGRHHNCPLRSHEQLHE